VGHLIASPEAVDVIIPRGGKGLIERISREAKVPVIKHLDGNCHVVRGCAVDLELALKVTDNAKTQKYSPCNAAESLLVHEAVAAEFLPRIGALWRPRASRCAATRAARPAGGAANANVKRPPSRTGRGVPRPHHQREGGRQPGRRDRPHQPLRLAPHRRDPHRQPQPRDALSCARSIRRA
jgi:hypothetical protein